MPVAIVTYAYTDHDIPEGIVTDFFNSTLFRDFCTGSLDPPILTTIDVVSMEEFFDECIFDGEATAEQRDVVIDWLRSIAPNDDIIIRVLAPWS